MIKESQKNTESTASYANSGVSTERAEEGLQKIIKRIKGTWIHPQGIGSVKLDIGQFANVIEIGGNQGLCIATDGVGTKALIASLLGRYDTIGIDCVAMNVNDVICVGARPLSMVDYIACQTADPDFLDALAVGLCDGAAQAGVSISGGEIAQLPDMLAEHKEGYSFDLAGTAVGIVSLDKVITGSDINEGDVVVGIESSGIHSNGLTLARHVFFSRHGLNVHSTLPGLDRPLGHELIKPTHIYAKEIGEMLDGGIDVKALAHITSDGFLNLTRVTSDVGYVIDDLPDVPAIFSLIQEYGNVTDEEMFGVYNMGIGFCVVVPESSSRKVVGIAKAHGKNAHIVGYAIKDEEKRVHISSKKLIGKGKEFVKG
jgi:phosphoribosylformylglycinamidine cyclo-ligase